MQENNNVGIIWIDERDFSILQIEWEPLSIQNYEGEKIRFPAGEYTKRVIWKVSYGIEKNGVRFPREQIIQEIFINDMNEKKISEEIFFTYYDYKFFTVETDIILK